MDRVKLEDGSYVEQRVYRRACDAATGYARAMSRRLREAGLAMSQKLPRHVTTSWGQRHSRTEGLYVHRIGCGAMVKVAYYCHARDCKRSDHAEVLQRAGEVLAAHGYALDGRGWFDATKKVQNNP